MPPVFEFTDHYDTTVTVFDRELPIKVKRYPRHDFDPIWKRSLELKPRGSAPESPEERTARHEASFNFFTELITSSVSLDEGVIVDRGQSVTAGADLVELFYNRHDVLAALAAAVVIENRVTPSLAKNSNSRRGSDSSSEQSSPTRRGDEQGPTVTAAGSSNSAAIEDAMAPSNETSAVDAPESSGPTSVAMAVA